MSVSEGPGPQVYDEPGLYEINYQAVIDTFGFLLTEVVVESVTCNDLFNNAPDIRIEVWNPEGERILETLHIDNAQPPLTFNVNLFIGEGNYVLRVMDEDSGIQGGDDECGTINFNRFSNGSFTNGGLQASLNIFHPVDTIRSVDTVRVYEQPEPPELERDGPETLCEGDDFRLLVANGYDSGLQWYQDSLPLIEIEGPALEVSASGEYWVTYTTPDGCSATSPVENIVFHPLPAAPVFQNFDNLLTLYDPEALPENYSLQWYQDGIFLEGANDTEYCIEESGTYLLEVVDEETGCTNSYELISEYDPAFPGCVPLGTGEEELPGLRAYPNPTGGVFYLEGPVGNEPVQITLFNGQGQVLKQILSMPSGGMLQSNLDLSSYPPGFYFLEARSGRKVANLKIVKQ